MEEIDEILGSLAVKVKPKKGEKKIFQPSKKDMKVEYPELSEMEEFSSMVDRDIRFCWYYGCPSSDIAKIQDKQERMLRAIKEAYGTEYFKFANAVKIASWEWPDYITIGVNRMARMNPNARSRAKDMINRLLDNFEVLIDVDAELLETWSPSERKSYVQLGSELSEKLPAIIQQLERGFAVNASKDGKLSDKETQEEHSGLMDRVISESEF